MKFLLAVLVSTTLVLAVSTRSRPRRQFSWSNSDDDGFVPPPSTTTANPSGADSTTTRAPVAYRNCMQACQSTPEYNPVCGSDGETYSNVGKLRCAAQCGRRVTLQRGGTCAPL